MKPHLPQSLPDQVKTMLGEMRGTKRHLDKIAFLTKPHSIQSLPDQVKMIRKTMRNLQKVPSSKSHSKQSHAQKAEELMIMLANLFNHPDWVAQDIPIDKEFEERMHWRTEFGERALQRTLSDALQIQILPITGSLLGIGILANAIAQGLSSISVLRRENGDVLRPQKDIYGELMRLGHRHHLVKIGLEGQEPLSIEAVDKENHCITVQINLDRKRGDIKRDIDVLMQLLDIEAKMLKIKLPTPKRPRFDNFQDMLAVYDLRNKEKLSWSDIAQRIFPTEVHSSKVNLKKGKTVTLQSRVVGCKQKR